MCFTESIFIISFLLLHLLYPHVFTFQSFASNLPLQANISWACLKRLLGKSHMFTFSHTFSQCHSIGCKSILLTLSSLQVKLCPTYVCSSHFLLLRTSQSLLYAIHHRAMISALLCNSSLIGKRTEIIGLVLV